MISANIKDNLKIDLYVGKHLTVNELRALG